MEEIQNKKRKRNPNWDDVEKSLLRDCVKDKLHILENKCTDTSTNYSKKHEWKKVFERFNQVNTKYRAIAELKQQWRVLKTDAKKSNIQAYQKTMNEKGAGGTPPSLHPNIMDILQSDPLKFEKDVNEFDSNSNYHNVNNTGDEDDDKINLDDEQESDCIQKQTSKQITHTKKIDRRESIDSHLRTREGRERRRKTNEELKATTDFRRERDEALIQFLQAEHLLKMEHLFKADARAQEEHALRMINLKLQNELLQKQIKQTK